MVHIEKSDLQIDLKAQSDCNFMKLEVWITNYIWACLFDKT